MSAGKDPSLIRASHILIKHIHSQSCSSLNDPSGAQITRRSVEDATHQLNAIRDDILANVVTFEQMAYHVSDCNSATNFGQLGLFGSAVSSNLPHEVITAAFQLKVGEISEVVLSPIGAHLIKRYE